MRLIITFLFAAALSFAASHPKVLLQTTQGDITLELYEDVAPLAVENFTGHVKNGYYNGLTFHRIIKNFMVQGGDPTGTGAGGESIWKKPFKDEFKSGVVFDKAGILAMANAGPKTNGSQFFITTAPTPWLNGYHTIFGRVVGGMDVLSKLNNVQTNGQYGGDKPLQTQKIIKATLLP
ncbi:MAG: peptidylprolyl isomerase [Sulfuricurvum sp. PD_MW2]|jgi:peptidylprolyl isomerase|uniref:peptidylprolyl isomerase n=1 Tax=Sulfuricurvum sp. PD_MW2 TaxID=2027917 RepID=UPI000C061871|nr:peptidylprolyl isomerase [Sulfuricurvum sp. PD_MW2]PHM18386.1 MAG: peptidylprolyl isomerase [Sulfuricurvum sp. PD_MW2]